MDKTIPLFWPYVPKKKILAEIKDTLNSRWLGQGPKVEKFEAEFGAKFGYKYSLFTNSGTSALELAYHLIGLKKSDEVIVPILDCTAGQMGLLRRGVDIVFADVHKETFNIDPDDVARKITKKTKAIVAVCLGGIPVDPALFKLAKKHKIPVITDAAQHHEPTNLPGDYVCYSFQAIKHITTCDGGMLVLRDAKTYKRAKLLRWFGIDRDLKAQNNYQAWQRRQMTFDIQEPGYKYQPTDIAACFGLAALPDLDKVIEYRKQLSVAYLSGLENVAQVQSVVGGSCWLYGILAEDRDKLAEFLRTNGVDVNMIHLRNDLFEVFKDCKSGCPNMDWIHDRYLYLPLNTKVTKSDVLYITAKIKEFYGQRNS